MLMPHDLAPRTAEADSPFSRVVVGGGGLMLVGLACLAMGSDGTLAMLLFLYLVGLAIVLRAMMSPPGMPETAIRLIADEPAA